MSKSSLDWLPKTLREKSQMRTLAAGEPLFLTGDKVYGIIEVISGRLHMVRHTIEGRAVIIHTSGAGELFADAALFSDAYHCDGVAAVASEVAIYEKEAILASLRADPDLAEQFMALQARQVQRLRTRLEQRNIRSARERLLHYLFLTAEDDGSTILLEGTLKDLAAELGLTHEVLYRTLARLEKEGAIKRTPTTILLVPGKAI